MSTPSRREFLKLAGAAGACCGVSGAGLPVLAGATPPAVAPDHFIPVEKKLDPEWLRGLTVRGEATLYQGAELDTIGMPVGGIACGQLYLAGDGRLLHWDIFNRVRNSGFGATNYKAGRQPDAPLAQGFAVEVTAAGKKTVRTLDRAGFPESRFCGEYPIGTVEYRDAALPVAVTLEAYSPFVPLAAADSALPATVMHFTVRNTSAEPVEVLLAGWLENAVGCHNGAVHGISRRNQVLRLSGLTMLVGSAEPPPQGQSPAPQRPPIVLADFEGKDYGAWKVEGKAFGQGPAHGTLTMQQPVTGFEGHGLVNTFLGGDQPQGKLTSPPFTIERRFISFLIGGGSKPRVTCMNLLVDGNVVRTATGKDEERLLWGNWDVTEWAGKEARIEIVDHAGGPWGHINVDQIELRDTPRAGGVGAWKEQPDCGTMGLAILGDGTDVLATAGLPGVAAPAAAPSAAPARGRKKPAAPAPATPAAPAIASAHWAEAMFGGEGLAKVATEAQRPLGQVFCGALGKRLALAAGAQAELTFVVAWCFPNLHGGNNLQRKPQRRPGNHYAVGRSDATAVAAYVAENFARLDRQTRLWRRTWYDSTLPHWLLDRLFSTTGTLATSTCQWWANGRFWAWEGDGCCPGTCGHVWNYAHTAARLFPELERSVREMQDYNPEAGFDAATGAIRFRGEDMPIWAGDSQPGYVLKVYREHQMSADDAFLRRLWPRVRKSLEFLIHEDGDGDGLIEGQQHNTYDINFFGANTMVGALYLGALRAGEEMARELGDAEFAATCRKIFERGQKSTLQRLYNGEYFIQQVDLAQHPKHQYADGCLADQMFGQGWSHQVGLGYLYPRENVASALRAIWKYNWAPDIAPQNQAHPPQRWFATPGEAGLFTCTWPRSRHLGKDSVLYRDEIWTGIEYQVAGHMVWEGMLTEALAMCRAIHDRYHPAKRNPWNEIECGDHYARGMASYGVFLALCGFECHGPKGHLGFAPKLAVEDFRAAFTAAEGWGTYSQKIAAAADRRRMQAELSLKQGTLKLRTLALELPEGAAAKTISVLAAGKPCEHAHEQTGRRLVLRFPQPIELRADQSLHVNVTA